MNLSIAWTLARAAGVAVLALPTAHLLARLVANERRALRGLAWTLLLVPTLTPVVLVGYAYGEFSLSLIAHPVLNELFYAALLLFKWTPVATVVLYFAPRVMSREAIYCRRLLGGLSPKGTVPLQGASRGGTVPFGDSPTRRLFRAGRTLGETVSFHLHAGARRASVAFAVTFLFAFAEFELANLMNVRTWTVALFDAQVGGLPLTSSLRLAAVPVAVEGLLLAAVMTVLFLPTRGMHLTHERPPSPGGLARGVGRTYLLLAFAVVVLVPAGVMFASAVRGMSVLVRNVMLMEDVASSLLFASSAAAVSYVAAGWFSSRRGGRARLAWACVLSLPGLLGGLVLALAVLWVFQRALLSSLYDTPLPLMLTLAALLFPFAALLRVLLEAFRPGERVHAAALLGHSSRREVRRSARRLLENLVTRRRLAVLFLLFFWGYFELPASALLAPSTMTPVVLRLYNMMHYGRVAGLSAMVLVAFVVPFVLFAAGRLVRAALEKKGSGTFCAKHPSGLQAKGS